MAVDIPFLGSRLHREQLAQTRNSLACNCIRRLASVVVSPIAFIELIHDIVSLVRLRLTGYGPATDDLIVDQSRLCDAIDALTVRLESRYSRIDPAGVTAIVQRHFACFDGCLVLDYVPLFVERRSCAELEWLQRNQARDEVPPHRPRTVALAWASV